MKIGLLLILLLFRSVQINAQISITFQLDLDSMTRTGLYSPESGDRVFVRGSFNHWLGNDYELERSEVGKIYCGTFELSELVGDTIDYKFVIQKEPDRIFWEHNPDPSNPQHGNRRVFITKEEILIPPTKFRYNEYISYPVFFSQEKLQSDFLQFRDILESTHPALYDYTDKYVLDSLFNTNYKRIDTALEFRTFLMLMTEVISKVGCGHSSLWVPEAYWNVAPDKMFPLKLAISDGRWYVIGSYNESQNIPMGSEIFKINGTPITIIIKRLESLTSADGFNRSYRLAKVVQNFSVKYALAFGFPEEFEVEYISREDGQEFQKSLQPVSKVLIDKGKQDHNELTYKIMNGGNVALLTINTFGYYDRVKMFHHFVDSVFQSIDKKGIKNLILDLRGNSGGDPFCAYYLWSYLQPKSLPYFEDHYGRYDTLANPIPMASVPFRGNLFTLIDGHCFSTTGHFCGLLKYHVIGKFVGSETGATYTCTGNATYPPLEYTGIMVGTAKERRYTAAVQNMDPMRGIIPDYPVEISVDDLLTQRDKVLEYTLNLITHDQ